MLRAEIPSDTPTEVAARIIKRHKNHPRFADKMAEIAHGRVYQAGKGNTVHSVQFNVAVGFLLCQRHLAKPAELPA